MTANLETSSVEVLKSRLCAAQNEAAEARAAADRAAAALQRDPSRERQVERNEAEQRCELIDLRIEKLRRDLEAAEAEARSEECQRVLDEHAADQTVVQEHERALYVGLEMIEGALEGLTGIRQTTRRRQGRLRAAGWTGDGLQLNLRPSRAWQRRVEALLRAYIKVTHPIMTG